MCKEKNSDGYSRSGGEGGSIVNRVWHKGEGLQQVAAAVGLLRLIRMDYLLFKTSSNTSSPRSTRSRFAWLPM